MCIYTFKLPDIGEGTTAAEIAAWHVGVGQKVTEDQPLVDVTTDKATVEITAPVSGTIVSLHGELGQSIAVGANLVVFEVSSEAPTGASGNAEEKTATSAALEKNRVAPESAIHSASAPLREEAPMPTRPLASPAVRQRARDRGVDLTKVAGTGPNGRITSSDLDGYVSSPKKTMRNGVREIKVIGVRRKIAEQMRLAKSRIPHFSYVEEIDVTALEELRLFLNGKRPKGPKLTLLPFLVAALAKAFPEFPQINARFNDDDGVVTQFEAVHVGMATQTSHGLVVPVIYHAEALGLWECASEIQRLSALARDGGLTAKQLSGSTVTITSLGALGGIATTPIINYPEVAVIGVNKIVERPMYRNGSLEPRKLMNLSSSFDHRVVDGWDAARFIQTVKGLLEQPAALFIE